MLNFLGDFTTQLWRRCAWRVAGRGGLPVQ